MYVFCFKIIILSMSLTIWSVYGKVTATDSAISQVEFCLLKLKLVQVSFFRHIMEHSMGDLSDG